MLFYTQYYITSFIQNNARGKKIVFYQKIILFIVMISFIGLFFFQGWTDPDGYAFYNKVCLKKDYFKSTIIVEEMQKKINCNELLFKLIQLAIIILIIIIINHFFPISLIGYISFFTIFLLSFEDDLIATPFIILLSFLIIKSLKKENSLLSRIIFGALFFIAYSIIGYFFWTGSFLIGAIVSLYFISAPLSIIPSIAYTIYTGMDTWGNAIEAGWGNGIIIGQVGLFISLIYFSWKKKKIPTNIIWLILSVEILSFFRPKWGEWIIIGLLPLLYLFWLELDSKWKKYVEAYGLFLIIITIFFSLFIALPTPGQWDLMKQAKVLQDNNNVVLNDWSLGHYLFYLNANPSDYLGYSGYPSVDNNYYWLGEHRPECDIVSFKDNMYLEFCSKK